MNHHHDSIALTATATATATASPTDRARETAALAEYRQRAGKKMILGGSVLTVLGVVLYCVACFSGGVDADMGDLLLRDAVPFAGATLAVLGFGTLVWLVGSFTYLRGAMDADETVSNASKSTGASDRGGE